MKIPESLTSAPAAPPALPRRRPRTVLKLASIAALVLLLLVPMGLVKGVMRERLDRRTTATRELASSWGLSQQVIGPVLSVPYRYRHAVRREHMVNGRLVEEDVQETETAYARFLPSALNVRGALDPSVLHRGIYDAIVYRGAIKISGSFAAPTFDTSTVAPEDILWNEAYVSFSITDLRGAPETLTLQWGNTSIPFVPGTGLPGFTSGVRAPLAGTTAPAGSTEFTLDLALNGSEGIRFAPLGARNDVSLQSSWRDPSFQGARLPVTRDVTAHGFTAHWQASYYGRSYPQQWTSRDASAFGVNDVTSSLLGVDLISVMNDYRLVERATKYGVLFMVLVFAGFFLFEILAGLRIHPFQYTLVGAALCLFYLALLSLSEFLPFAAAYAAGAATATTMITLYCASVLRGGGRALIVAGELATIYGVLFVILRLQDYALLFGTAGLFAALGIMMFATRNIDWYARDEVPA